MNLKKQAAGKKLTAADMKIIKGAWGGWGNGCETGGFCNMPSDCRVFPSGCFSFSPIILECYDNHCILLDYNTL